MRKQPIKKKNVQRFDNVDFLSGSYNYISLLDGSVDIVIEGWSFAYLYTLVQPNWKIGIDSAFSEIQRIVKPGGIIILIETLGTM